MLTAITRAVSPSINRCELTYLERQPIDVARAREQHRAYEDLLRELGVRVISLPAEPDYPDSVFVEDPAVVVDEVAVMTNPGVESRRGEIESIARALGYFRAQMFDKAFERHSAEIFAGAQAHRDCAGGLLLVADD